MSKISTMLVTLVAMVTVSGCMISRAHVESRPGSYEVRGHTHSPEAAIQVANQAYVEQYNAEHYWEAVEAGRAAPYMGGGYGNDYWFWYGGGVMPAAPNVMPNVPAGTTTAPQGANVDPVAREKADDALKAVIEHVGDSGK